MKKLVFIILTFFMISYYAESNEPFVVLEYNQSVHSSGKKLNKENIFIKNQNHSAVHKVLDGESLSGILKEKYYGNSGLNMKILEVSLIQMNKHAFVKEIILIFYFRKKNQNPLNKQVMNLVKNINNNQTSSEFQAERSYIFFMETNFSIKNCIGKVANYHYFIL